MRACSMPSPLQNVVTGSLMSRRSTPGGAGLGASGVAGSRNNCGFVFCGWPEDIMGRLLLLGAMSAVCYRR